jgi:hypothetical protein
VSRVLGVLLLLAACSSGGTAGTGARSSSSTTATGPTLSGRVILFGRGTSVLSASGVGSDCATAVAMGSHLPGTHPTEYDSWKAGAPVVLRNGRGEVLASGPLSTGVASPAPIELGAGSLQCTFTFSIPNIPTAANWYSIRIGNGTSFPYSRGALVSLKWTLEIDGNPR